MIPILFADDATTFTSLGIGVLADTITARVKRVLNGKDELELSYPTDSNMFAELKNDRIILAEPEYKKAAQPYRIYQITKPMKGSVKVYARHISEQKSFIPVMPFSATSVTEVFARLNSYTAETSPFTFWTDKTTTGQFELTAPASLGNVLGGMAGSIIDRYGGEYEFDGYTVKLYNRRGIDRGVYIRYGKNLTKLEQKENMGSTVTGVCPYWKSMDGSQVVVLPEKVVESQYADLYAYRRTVTRDFSEMFQDGAPTVSQLRAAAQSYIEGTGIGSPQLSLDISFEHLAQYSEYENVAVLETVNLGDTVHVEYEALNVSVSARIVETDYDVLREKYNSVKIGKVKASLAQTIQDISKSIEGQFTAIASSLDQAVIDATAKITGANGGNVVTHFDANGKPYEILIMDTDNIMTATNVLRINMNGIGFSHTGYAGPYTTAWTIDGHFVADFIDTGTLTAELIKAGILSDSAGRNYWNMETGEIHIESLSDFGGRNLIKNTLVPSVASSANYPTIVGGASSSVGGTASTATHGIKVTAESTGTWLSISFGGPVPASGMNGLVAGQTYTISFDASYKLLTGYTGENSWALGLWAYTTTGLWKTWEIRHAINASNAGTEYTNEHHTFTFTIPNDATSFRLFVRMSSSSQTYTATGDYIRLDNIKLEKGEVATDWSPAPEDAQPTISSIGGRNYWWAVSKTIHTEVTLERCTCTYDEKLNGKYVVTATNASGFQQALFPANVIMIPSNLLGEKMIFHADSIIASGANDPRVCLIISDSNGQQIGGAPYITPSSLLTTFTIPSNAVSFRPLIRVRQTGTTTVGEAVTVVGVKIETGTIPTAWTPAPEDAISAIENGDNNTYSQASSALLTQVDIINGKIETEAERITTLQNGLQEMISTTVNQTAQGLSVNIQQAYNMANYSQQKLDAYFDFTASGLSIRGTSGSTTGSYLNLSAAEVALFVNNSKRLWLNAEGANAEAFVAQNSVTIGNFVWEQYPNGFRLRKV